MSVFWGTVWGIVSPAIMFLTIQYYLPKLFQKAQKATAEAPDLSLETGEGMPPDTEETRTKWQGPQAFLFRSKPALICTLVLCAVFAGFCGYRGSIYATSAIALVRMMCTFFVLSCVFVTDLEFYTIPNLCSVVLLAARAITIICEFIWRPDYSWLYVVDSVVALAVCLILLLLMRWLTRGGIGMGDVKLFSSIGFMCGISTVCYTLALAFLSCALVSTVLLITKKRQLKDLLPMGPFIWVGFGVSVLLAII